MALRKPTSPGAPAPIAPCPTTTIAADLKSNFPNTKPCRDSAEMLDHAYSQARDDIHNFIRIYGTDEGDDISFLSFAGADYFPSVLTYIPNPDPNGFDTWREQYVLGLMVDEDGDVWFYASDIKDDLCEIDAFDNDGKPDYEHWHQLDWDMNCSYQHNVERIAYYIGKHYIEECFDNTNE